jgi:hypothetical protein
MRAPGVVVAAAAAIAICGCGNGDGDDVVAEPSAVTAAESDVEQAYTAYWAMVTRLETELPTQDAEIAQRTTGPALVELTSEVAMLELQRQLNRHNDGYEHQVLSVEVDDAGAVATLRDCFVDDTTLVDLETGEVLASDDGKITTSLLEVDLVQRDGWQVQTIETLATFDGAAPESCLDPTAE